MVYLLKQKLTLVCYYQLNFRLCFNFTCFSTNVLCLFQESIQDTTLKLVVMFPQIPQVCVNILVFFLFFYGLNSFEDTWLHILQNVPQFGLFHAFQMIKLELQIWGIKTTLVEYASHHMMSEIHDTYMAHHQSYLYLSDFSILRLLFFPFHIPFFENVS